jgi:tetratricopeptide (TPR) repeat protein
MTKDELLERYEALGDERDFEAARALYERALAETVDARLLNDYGYLLECHGRRALRRAVESYERAIEADPAYDKPHYQLISARAALGDAEHSVGDYECRLARSRNEVREYRFLGWACVMARDFTRALAVADAGLAVATRDAQLLAVRGEAKAGLRDADGALADWREAAELDPEDIAPLYSSAFLLERAGRLAEAAAAWRSIIAWNESRGYALQTEWPRQELERVLARRQDASKA